MASLPYFLIDRIVLQPMRWATAGTIMAAEMAQSTDVCVNMSGGYHHASEQRGEGFCLFSDVGVAVALLRKKHLLSLSDNVAIIDLDAHQGNGFERVFMQDTSVHIFDMYNGDIYPNDGYAKTAIQADIPLPMGSEDNVYLNTLKAKLPDFLDKCKPVKLAFYNAGSDILSGDPLGGFDVSAQAVVARDVYVFKELIKRNIPFVMLLSGGYTKTSYEIIADSVTELINMRCKTR